MIPIHIRNFPGGSLNLQEEISFKSTLFKSHSATVQKSLPGWWTSASLHCHCHGPDRIPATRDIAGLPAECISSLFRRDEEIVGKCTWVGPTLDRIVKLREYTLVPTGALPALLPHQSRLLKAGFILLPHIYSQDNYAELIFVPKGILSKTWSWFSRFFNQACMDTPGCLVSWPPEI